MNILKKSKNQIKLLIVIFLLAIFCRVVGPLVKHPFYSYKYFVSKAFILTGNNLIKYSTSDEWVYNLTAKSIISGHGFAINLKEMFGGKIKKGGIAYIEGNDGYFTHKIVPPVYPIFLAAFYFIFGINTFSFFLPQILLGSITCILMYFIAKEIFNEAVATITGLMVIIYPDLVFWTYMVRVETLFIFLIALVFWLLLRKDLNRNNIYAVIIGIIIGFACLTRIIFVFFVPIIIVWKYLNWEGNKKGALLWLLALFLSCSLILFPWAIRNYWVFNSFTIITDEAGTAFVDYPGHQISPTDSSVNYVGKSYLQLYINFIWNNSSEFASKCFYRLILYLSPFTQLNDGVAKIYKGLTWVFVFPAAFWGIFVAAKKYWARSGLLILYIFYYILFHSLTFVDTGLVYRYPILPFLCIFAAYAYGHIYDKFNQRKIKKAF